MYVSGIRLSPQAAPASSATIRAARDPARVRGRARRWRRPRSSGGSNSGRAHPGEIRAASTIRVQESLVAPPTRCTRRRRQRRVGDLVHRGPAGRRRPRLRFQTQPLPRGSRRRGNRPPPDHSWVRGPGGRWWKTPPGTGERTFRRRQRRGKTGARRRRHRTASPPSSSPSPAPSPRAWPRSATAGCGGPTPSRANIAVSVPSTRQGRQAAAVDADGASPTAADSVQASDGAATNPAIRSPPRTLPATVRRYTFW